MLLLNVVYCTTCPFLLLLGVVKIGNFISASLECNNNNFLHSNCLLWLIIFLGEKKWIFSYQVGGLELCACLLLLTI